MALGINVLLVPVNISTGGVSGIGTILYHTMNVPLWITTISLNGILFIFGFKTLDKSEIKKTAVGILLLTVFLGLTEHIPVFTEDITVSAVFGGIIMGAGIGLTVKHGASTGGSDFAAMMLNKLFPHISVASFIMLLDVVVILVSGAVFRNNTLMLYSVVGLFFSSKVTDYILVSGNFAKCMLIISPEYEKIAQGIMSELSRGITGVFSKGLYYKNNGMMLMCVLSGKQVPKAFDIIKKIDKNAFVVITDAREVHGEGFTKG